MSFRNIRYTFADDTRCSCSECLTSFDKDSFYPLKKSYNKHNTEAIYGTATLHLKGTSSVSYYSK